MVGGGRHADGRLGWLPLFALAFAGVFVFSLVTGLLPFEIDDTATSSPPGRDNPVGPDIPTSTAADQPSVRAQTGGCKELWAHELRVALAAEATLQEWRLHIDTMDQLVAGDLTLAQASALWDDSEKGALRRIDRFKRLDADLRATPNNCDSRRPTTPVAAGCAKAAHAVERTIDAARTAVQTWRLHIREMRKLRAGQISVEHARADWHRLWRTGQVQTVRYDHRAAIALGRDCS